MADMDPTWLGAVMAKHAKDNSVVAVLDVKTEPGVGVGDNYSSVIVRATLKVVLGSGRVTTKKVIMKKGLTNISKDVAVDMLQGFHIEGIVYNEVLSKYESLMNEKNLPYSKFWPDCMFTSHNIIVFEDLKTSGFTLASRKIGLDSAHVELVLTNLARLHALSLTALSSGIIYPKILPPYLMINTPMGDSFLSGTLKSLADVIRDTWSSQWSQVEKKIRDLTQKMPQILDELYKQPHKLSVVNHGDCWVNNMMFKYNSSGVPTEQKFLDFQISYYNSYAWDLSYFLHTSVHPKQITSNYDSYIEFYCKEFSESLDKLGLDASRAPTVEEVKDELTRLRLFALAVSCTILPIVANPGDVELNVDDLLNDSPKVRKLYEDKTFEETIQQMLNNFIKLGVL